jgi:outer membrane receptor protein involved in Fe transport
MRVFIIRLAALVALPIGIVRAQKPTIGPDSLVTDSARVISSKRVPILSPTVIAAERSFSTASSSAIRRFDIELRPRASSQELLRLAPGLVIAQHAGGGKAEQLYLRGFDADHGTDVAISVDGIPVNMVTHAHGQGYADLHWLMPEIVQSVDVRKGPFDVRDGDFATAGSVSFRTADRVDSRFALRTGAFGLRHGIALAPFGGNASEKGGYFATSLQRSDGPFHRPQGHERVNAFGKVTAPLGTSQLFATASAFRASWDASGQVPDRAVRSGAISRFGSVDDTEGGSTSRYDLSAGATGSQWEARVFATKYNFDLFSNFTFFLADSLNGDGIEQVDDRFLFGASGSWKRPTQSGIFSVGSGTRVDDGDVALHGQRARTRLHTKVDVHNRQLHFYQWARYEAALGSRVRLDAGMRADVFRFSVRNQHSTRDDDLDFQSGTRWQGIVSPRLNLAFDAATHTQLFVNAGTGFHSNDARDVVLAASGDNVLPRAVSSEVGVRQSWAGGSLGVAAWWLDLQSETVFVGDEGTTEASGRTRRVGVDLELRQQLTPTLWFDGDLNIGRGRFRDEPRGADRVPLAPTRTATVGLTSRRGASESGLRVRHIGSRAAIEDNSVRAQGSTIWEAFAAWMVGPFRLTGTVDNLFNATWNEAQFSTTSRLRGESAPVTELHYTPGSPRSLSIGVEWRFE